MKAMIIQRYGDPEVFVRSELAKPEVKPGALLIKTAASSVNPIDTKVRSGAVRGVVKQFPAVLHGDVSGIVEAVGKGVTGFKKGDEVYACTSNQFDSPGGALADYVLADASSAALKPSTLSFAEAAVVPLVTITAWQALIDRAKLQKGQNVLIHGATGGVGHAAVQIAKAVGAQVFTTVSSKEKADIARSLGADHVINYKETAVEEYVHAYTGGKGFEVVFDTVGGANLDRSFQAAAPNGTVCAIAARSTHDLTPLHSKGLTLHVVFMLLSALHPEGLQRQGEILSEIGAWAETGKFHPLVDEHSFTFAQVGDAHRFMESGQATGKISVVNEQFG